MDKPHRIKRVVCSIDYYIWKTERLDPADRQRKGLFFWAATVGGVYLESRKVYRTPRSAQAAAERWFIRHLPEVRILQFVGIGDHVSVPIG